MLWGYPLQFWQTIVFWLWAIAAGAGGVAVAASFGSSIVSYYISDATETAAKIEIDKAKAVAGRANEAAGEANERAAQLRLAFEQEQVKRLQLEKDVGAIKPQVQSLMPAEIDPRKMAILVGVLKGARGNTSISYDGGDARAQPLSVQLQRAFHEAGWTVSGGMVIGISLPPKTGILIKGNEGGLSESQKKAAEAMEAAQIPFDLRLERQSHPDTRGMSNAPAGRGADDVEIVVTAPQR